MSWTVPVALYGWIPFVAIVFAALPPARAALVSYLAGWMFLPVAGFQLLGFFDYTKSTAVPLVVFLAVLAFDGRSLQRVRLGLVDLPMALFCIAPMVSSLGNGLGGYDALSALTYQTITWGLPYLTGRIYFSSPNGMRRLAVGLFVGALVYAPLCLWEVRMSPQLHAQLYGFHQHDWLQTLRSGGYRPMVFLHHGLMLGLWMSAAALIGITLWAGGALRRVLGMPLWLAVPGLLVTSVLCKSFGALVLLAIGALVLVSMRTLRTSLPMALLLCLPPAYVSLRTLGAWPGNELTGLVAGVSEDRAQSLAFRLEAEEKLRVRAAERPLIGWGGWGRSFVRRFEDPRRRDTVTTDSLWILVYGKHGALGLASLLLTFVTPVLALWRRRPPRAWKTPGAAVPWALALVLTLYGVDNLVNAMLNPLYLLIAGGLGAFALAPARVRQAARVAWPRARTPIATG